MKDVAEVVFPEPKNYQNTLKITYLDRPFVCLSRNSNAAVEDEKLLTSEAKSVGIMEWAMGWCLVNWDPTAGA